MLPDISNANSTGLECKTSTLLTNIAGLKQFLLFSVTQMDVKATKPSQGRVLQNQMLIGWPNLYSTIYLIEGGNTETSNTD